MNIDHIAIPLLSVETGQAKRQAPTFAYCVNCKRLYQDDIPVQGSVMCPHCDRYALFRGLTKEAIEQKRLEIRPRDEVRKDPRLKHQKDRRRTKPV